MARGTVVIFAYGHQLQVTLEEDVAVEEAGARARRATATPEPARVKAAEERYC